MAAPTPVYEKEEFVKAVGVVVKLIEEPFLSSNSRTKLVIPVLRYPPEAEEDERYNLGV